ncbi:hypothetical protein 3 [Beihai tombus-like virus 19]|uniref:hypothetical protein 3 n=1 Tax=Beihai tombus-like virus 19 TaxID=1922722 RepID=UPI00090A65B8|nr:hypothetical protein 3 [Beihai tombus-like virus 19]APG76135.1 hypothetical protein 3 [Beihai tombus-like virus 19]
MAGGTKKRTGKRSKPSKPAASAAAQALARALQKQSRPKPRPARKAEKISGPGMAKTSRLSGSDFLGELHWDGTDTVAKRILLSPHLKPTMWQGTRLAQLATNWQKYRFTRCTLQFNTSLPSVVQASMLVYYSPDSSDDYSAVKTTADMLQVFASGYGAKRFAATRDFSMALPVKVPGNQWFFTTTTPTDSAALDRWISQGRVWIVLAGLPMGASGQLGATTIGTVTMNWDVEFSMPDREISTLPAIPPTPKPGPDLVFHLRLGMLTSGNFTASRGIDVSVWGAYEHNDAGGSFNGWGWDQCQVQTIYNGATEDESVDYNAFNWWIDHQSQAYLDGAAQHGDLADKCAIRIVVGYQQNQPSDAGKLVLSAVHCFVLSQISGTWRWDSSSSGAVRDLEYTTPNQANIITLETTGFIRDADQNN